MKTRHLLLTAAIFNFSNCKINGRSTPLSVQVAADSKAGRAYTFYWISPDKQQVCRGTCKSTAGDFVDPIVAKPVLSVAKCLEGLESVAVADSGWQSEPLKSMLEYISKPEVFELSETKAEKYVSATNKLFLEKGKQTGDFIPLGANSSLNSQCNPTASQTTVGLINPLGCSTADAAKVAAVGYLSEMGSAAWVTTESSSMFFKAAVRGQNANYFFWGFSNIKDTDNQHAQRSRSVVAVVDKFNCTVPWYGDVYEFSEKYTNDSGIIRPKSDNAANDPQLPQTPPKSSYSCACSVQASYYNDTLSILRTKQSYNSSHTSESREAACSAACTKVTNKAWNDLTGTSRISNIEVGTCSCG